MFRLFRALQRTLRGEDVVVISQSPASWEAQYKKGLWDRLVDAQPNTEFVAKEIHKKGYRKVLDVGCGNGALGKSVLPLAPDAEFTGIDISETAIAQAAKLTPKARWIVGDIAHAPTDCGEFEVIVFNEVLYYVDIAKVLPAYKPLLKSDGVVIISIVRSWRTLFLIRRIKAFVSILNKWKIDSQNNTWDIWEAKFK